MLTRDDAVIQTIADGAKHRRRQLDERKEALKKEFETFCETLQSEDVAALKQLHARLAELGVKVFNGKDHEIDMNPEEGVVWLVAKNDKCTCAVCQLGSIVIQVKT